MPASHSALRPPTSPDCTHLGTLPVESTANRPNGPPTQLVNPSLLGGYKNRSARSPRRYLSPKDHSSIHCRIVISLPEPAPRIPPLHMKRNRDRFDGLSGNRRLPLDANDGSCKDHSLPREPSAEIGRALQKLESAQSAGEPEGGRSAPEQDREKTPQLVQVHPESVPGLQAVPASTTIPQADTNHFSPICGDLKTSARRTAGNVPAYSSTPHPCCDRCHKYAVDICASDQIGNHARTLNCRPV